MAINRNAKRVIGARRKKTGKADAAARSVVRKTGKARSSATVSRRAPGTRIKAAPQLVRVPASEYAAVAGYGDAVLKTRTGCTWQSWVGALDYAGGRGMTHTEIAKHLRDAHKLSSWWAQMVTVGYERITGLRERGQRRGGLYEVGVSKTVGVPVTQLFRAFAEPSQRRRWLQETGIRVRTSVPGKSVRITWSDRTSVEVYFTAKGAEKSTVSVQHVKLPVPDQREVRRAYWKERLSWLADYLSGGAD